MAKSRNTYTGGLNKDTSKSKYAPNNYYDALNIRIVTDGGLSTGSIENEKGNLLSFKLPDLPLVSITHKDNSVSTVPAALNLKIIGWATIDNYIVIFSTDSSDSSPSNSTGQIWKIQYDETTNTIIDADPTTSELNIGAVVFNVGKHLIYNNLLNFSTAHRIEAIGRYENSTTARVYWTDYNNQIRSLNVNDPKVWYIKPNDVDIKPNLSMSQPIIRSIGAGTLPAGAVIQVAYRLISSEGAQTVLSPTSPLINLTTVDPNSDILMKFKGAAANASTSRSITYTISNIDTDYSVIEHIAIIYIDQDAPTIYKFGEQSIPSSGVVTVLLAGSETKIPVTVSEFNKITVGFDKCKTLTSKDNILVAGNITTTKTDIDDTLFDARAYRFNSSRSSLIKDDALSDIYIDGITKVLSSGGSWLTLPIDHDAINPYNNERVGRTWFDAEQYKFQSDGTTYGGEGPFIKYAFTTKTLDGDRFVANETMKSSPHIDVLRSSSIVDLGVVDLNNSIITHNVNNQFNNFASPIITQLFTGYTRGEVYRFGIEFISLKGSPSFVKWIGDIKFPQQVDGYTVANGELDSGLLSLYSLGIEFTIDISSIRDQISGYRIVRAERPLDQMSKLGTGTIMIIDSKVKDTRNGSAIKNSLYEAFATDVGVEVGNQYIEYNGTEIGVGAYHLPDSPGFNNVDDGTDTGPHKLYPVTRSATILIHPMSLYKDYSRYSFLSGDYIKTTGYYKARAQQIRPIASNAGLKNQMYEWRCRTFEAVNPTDSTNPHNIIKNGYESFEIDKTYHMAAGEKIENSSPHYPAAISPNPLYGITYGITSDFTKNYPFGVGDNIYLVSLKTASTPHITTSDLSTYMGWNSNVIEGNNVISAPTTGYSDTQFRFKEVSYCRPIAKQYNGNTFEDRSKQQYISTNHYQMVGGSVPNALTFKVYGGDTYVNYMDQEYIQQYWAETQVAGTPYTADDTDRKLAVAVLFPVESSVNINLNQGIHFAADRDGDNSGEYQGETHTINPVYKQQNNVEDKFFAKDFNVSTSEEFVHRLWASQRKTDGEQLDSWKIFKDANYIDVEGTHGPINKVINFKDLLYFYQDRAFGVGSINERSQVTDTTGVQVTLGTGQVLDDYRYVSTTSGSNHQFSIVNSGTSLYYYDANNAKLMSFGPSGTGMGLSAISDLKGMSSFFANEVKNLITNTDKTLGYTGLSAIGVHGIYDARHGRVLFTFTTPANNKPSFTISFNEYLNSFESFYSFTPNIYMQIARRLLSVNPNDPKEVYLHNEGVYGSYYGATPDSSYITMLVAPEADVVKIFNNIEYNSEIELGTVNIPLETISRLELYNEYQQSGVIPLTVGTNIKRRMRHWRYTIGRDTLSTNQTARFRNYTIFLKLIYDNNNDKHLVLHDVIVSYTTARN